MHLPALITDLAVMLLTAGVVTVIFKKIKQPLVLGYIAAGFLIGPYMPLFFTVEDAAAISTWSEIGIIILMFCLGLEFNLHKLVKVGGTGVITALTEVGGMLLLGYLAGQAMGWTVMDSVFLGGMLSMSSTTIIIKAFDELGVTKENFAQLVFGTLVIEDIAGIFMMIILSTISVSQNISGGALALQLAMLVLYLVLWLILGIYLLPTAFNRASPLMNDETLLIVSLGTCFGMVLLANALGFSSALGAFLAGSLLAGTVHAERVEHLTSSVKDLFGSVFFLSVGMMLDPATVKRYIVPILIITLVTIVGKLIFSSLGVLAAGQTLSTAVHCGCSLAQIGEFAFIIASLGLSLGVIADYIYPIIVSVSILTTLTTPTFIRSADKIAAGVERLLPQRIVKKLDRLTDAEQSAKEQDGDWAAFLQRYLRKTVFYGVLMFGTVVLGSTVALPLLQKLLQQPWMSRVLTLLLVYFVCALFVRPMLDRHSSQFTTLWMKNRSFRLPLQVLSGLRLLLIVLIAFVALQVIADVNSLWVLPVIALAVLLISRSGRIASMYLNVEARFLTNFNERLLQSGEDGAILRLDNTLFVLALTCPPELDGESLRRLEWGRRFGTDVIRIVRGGAHINIPSGAETLQTGDTVFILGEAEHLRTLCIALGLNDQQELPTLRKFEEADAEAGDLYTFVLSLEQDSPLVGLPIRQSGLREGSECMVLGLERNKLPILRPDINTVLQSGDIVWLLGTRTMAEELLTKDVD